MSSFSAGVRVEWRCLLKRVHVFATFGAAQVTLCVKFPCDIMYIIISTRLQLNADVTPWKLSVWIVVTVACSYSSPLQTFLQIKY